MRAIRIAFVYTYAYVHLIMLFQLAVGGGGPVLVLSELESMAARQQREIAQQRRLLEQKEARLAVLRGAQVGPIFPIANAQRNPVTFQVESNVRSCCPERITQSPNFELAILNCVYIASKLYTRIEEYTYTCTIHTFRIYKYIFKKSRGNISTKCPLRFCISII